VEPAAGLQRCELSPQQLHKVRLEHRVLLHVASSWQQRRLILLLEHLLEQPGERLKPFFFQHIAWFGDVQ
jgi:hypothetical protein